MTKRKAAVPAPGPLEAYAAAFDPLFGKLNQRAAFRRYLEGLLLPTERNKTLTALANTEPVVGAQLPRAQALQWFLSESDWDPAVVNARRVEVLRADPLTAPTAAGVLVIDEHGDRKWGSKTAHIGKQYLANLGKIDTGVVSVTSLWADEQIYYPLDVEPYTPAHHFAGGKHDPQFRTKLVIARELVARAVSQGIPFRAVVADSFYGDDAGFTAGLQQLQVGYVLALQPSHAWVHLEGAQGTLWQVALGAGWQDATAPGAWVPVERTFRDAHHETWWALEVRAGPYGPDHAQRAVVVTTDPAQLPERSTWYLVTNLPAPHTSRAQVPGARPAAALTEIVRLYGLRMWVEQSYKQTKHALGWSQYQVRSDVAIRRHWTLVWCAFSFCWYQQQGEAHAAAPPGAGMQEAAAAPASDTPSAATAVGRGKNQRRGRAASNRFVAGGAPPGTGMAGTLDHAATLLARVVVSAPTSCRPTAPRLALARTRH
jgi:SRSO17 transposase